MSKDRGIPISQKHGVNPSLLLCPVCGEATGVALMGRLPNDAEAPRNVLDIDPCEACQKLMEEHAQQGCLILVVLDRYTQEDRQEGNSFWPHFHSYHVISREAQERNGFPPRFIMSLSDAVKMGLIEKEENT